MTWVLVGLERTGKDKDEIQGSFASLQDDDLKQATAGATAGRSATFRMTRFFCDGDHARATAGPYGMTNKGQATTKAKAKYGGLSTAAAKCARLRSR
jgi:hypothetical protein